MKLLDLKRWPRQSAQSAVRPKFDLTGFNRLADELEDQAIIERQRRP